MNNTSASLRAEALRVLTSVTNNRAALGHELIERLQRELQPEHRQAILAIKRHYHRQGLLRDGLSVRICLAVLDQGVQTPEQFEALRRRS